MDLFKYVIYEPSTRVKMLNSGYDGIIIGAYISPFGVSYRISYFDGSCHQETNHYDIEFEVVEGNKTNVYKRKRK